MRFAKSVMALAIVGSITVFGGHNAYAADTKQTQKAGSDSQAQTDTNAKKPVTVNVTVNQGDTLTTIAAANHTTIDAVMKDNGITDANLIEPGQTLTVTKGDDKLTDYYDSLKAAASAFITPPAPVAASVAAQSGTVVARSANSYTTRSYSAAPTSSSSYYVGNGMWCTDYVHSRRPDVAVYGNAGYNWIGSAQAAGKATGGAPQAGAVAVMNGHVAYVESVNSDGSYVVSEMGWNYQPGNYNKRTVTPGTFGQFIY